MGEMDWNTNWLSTPQGLKADRIRSLASALFEQMPPDQYEHGEQHCWAMEFAIHRLIPRRYYELLKEEERFLLLTSPWILNIAWNRAWNKPERLDDDYLEANEYLNNPANQVDLGISPDEAKVLNFMILYHRSNKRLEDCPPELHVGPEPIKVRLLTAYLRLADAIHIDDNISGPSSLFYFLDDPGSPELFHWFKNKLRLSIEPDPDDNTINMYVQSPIPISESLIQRVKEDLELHVDAVSKTLLIYDVTKYLSVNLEYLRQGPPLTDVDKNEVGRLLKEFALSFPRNAGVLQELYISSVKSAFKKSDISAPAIINEIKQVQAIAKESYSFRPYHIAFARMINEVNTLLMEDVAEGNKADALKQWADSTQRAREERLERVSEWGSNVLRDFDHFLLFGFSNTIIGTMKTTFSGNNALGNDIHIYVCEAHNKSRFDLIGRLIYVDGMNYASQLRAELPKATVTLIPDITVADVLNLKRNEGRWIALFGSDGITPDARCCNTSGNLTLAIIAKQFGIPVCVICDSYKMGNLPPRSLSERQEQWMKSVPHWRSERVKLQNLRESVIEPEMISTIITEHGAFTTAEFRDRYSR